METLYIEETNTASQMKPKSVKEGLLASTVFSSLPEQFLFWDLEFHHDLHIMREEMSGTTIFTIDPTAQPENEDDDYETGYFNDEYDIVAKTPISKSFKVKVKVRNTSKFQPKVFIDEDILN